MTTHPQLDRLALMTMRNDDRGTEQSGALSPQDHVSLTGAARQLRGTVPLFTALLYVHAALLRASMTTVTVVTAHAGGGGGGGGGRNGVGAGGGATDRDAFSAALMSVKGLGVLLAFVSDTVGWSPNPGN